MSASTLPPSLIDNPRLDQWVGFADERVMLRTGKVEIGQGILTALVQIAADELDVALEQVRLAPADTVTGPNEGYTAGSRSIDHSGGAIRLVCAEVHAMLLDAAALQLNCAPADLAVADGRVMRGAEETGLSYWSMAGVLDLARAASGTAPVKQAQARRFVGTDVRRLDLAEKLGGTPYIQDIAAAGMLHARVLHRPRLGARLAGWDEAAAARAGHGRVEFLLQGDALAVLGEDEADTAAAFERLRQQADWEGGVDLSSKDEEATALLDLPTSPERIIEQGQPAAQKPVQEMEASFSRPYLAHASIAPSCGLAQAENGRLTVWSHSQGIFFLRNSIARALGLTPEAVTVIHHQGAGCYGHNGADDAAFDAAFLAWTKPGRLVRVLWTREDELGVAPFGAAMMVRIKAGLDEAFRPVSWRFDIWSPTHGSRPGANSAVNLLTADALPHPPVEPPPSDVADATGGGATRNSIALYDFPHQVVAHHFIPAPPVRTSSMRGLGAFCNVFSIECFMDEMAEMAETDSVDYRLSLMTDPRARRVIEAAAEMADWHGAPAEADNARGFAFSRYKNIAAYVAIVAELSVDETVRLRRVWCAADAGLVINPDGARNQIEGGIIQGASWALKEQVRFGEGRVTSDRWAHYPILRFSEIPSIEIKFVGNPADPTLGVGEVSQGPIAAAIGNAVARALGLRLRHLPLTRERIMAALLDETG
jgi:nicotinate dehydrogenase subunit B